MRTLRALLAVVAVASLLPLAPAGAQDGDGVAVDPYVDRSQLAGRPSFLLQPWRGWMDTVPATRFLDGIGAQYRVPAGTDHDATIGLLAEAGVHRLRFEVPWNDMQYGGGGMTSDGQRRLEQVLAAAERHDVGVLLLLNANSSEPTPHETTEVVVAADAGAGSRSVRLESVDGLVAGRSGFTGMASDVMAGVLFTEVDGGSGTVSLGQPLPVDLEAGDTATVDTLEYAPLHAVGTPEFEATADGWEDFVRAVLDVAGGYALPDVQVEVWNETAFGSRFLDIAHYELGVAPEGDRKFRPGGRAWELGRRTVDVVASEHPEARVVWGFSNTNFYATPVTELPPGTGAVSYHPYGTGLVEVPTEFPDPSQRASYDVVPHDLRLAVPEGRTALAVSPNPLTRRRLAPGVREAAPPGSDGFEQVITEHGCTPREAGIADPVSAMHHKARCLLRYLPFWLNKGIAELYISRAWDADPLGRGILNPEGSPARGDDLSTDALAALANLVDGFEGAVPIEEPRQLGVEVVALGEQRRIFGGRGEGSLWHRDVLAVLPFQVTATRFTIATYVLTYDATDPIEPEPYRLTITGVDPEDAEVRWYDPLVDEEEPVEDLVRGEGSVTVTVEVTDTARLLIVDEDPSAAPESPVQRWLPPGPVVVAVLAVLVVGGGLLAWFLLRRPAMAGPSPYPGDRPRRPRRDRGGRRRRRRAF